MARVVLIIGDTGAGKSAAWRNMDPAKCLVITPNDKQFPWKGAATKWGKRMLKKTSFEEVTKTLSTFKPEGTNFNKGIKYILIEDMGHLFNNQMYSTQFLADGLNTNKYFRYEKMGAACIRMITEANALPSEMVVFMNAHTEEMAGKQVLQLFGQMVRNYAKPEGWTEMVLHALVLGDKKDPNEKYVFLTNDDGTHQAKSPMGMFEELYIPNDINKVAEAIEEYGKPA